MSESALDRSHLLRCDQIREYTDATINGALSAVDYNILDVHALPMLVSYVIMIGAKIRDVKCDCA